jgi:3-hydroxybutyryl-CoA dehydrogenase
MKRLGKVVKLLSRDPKFFAAERISEQSMRDEILGCINPVTELAALGECGFVIEAAPEVLQLKHDIFSELSQHCSADTVLASNTSSLSITEIATGATQPERVVGMHFFNPPSAMQLVEVVPGLNTADETLAKAMDLAVQLGKKPIRVKETPGFVVNRVLMAMMNEAMTLHEEGVASIADIDEAMKIGAGFPLGPFKLADLVGLDVLYHAEEIVYNELGRDKFHPPYTLRQHVRAGRLGRKTRHGFYKY